MILGSSQYILRGDDSNVIYVSLMHHPIDWYMDKAEAKPYLHNRVRLSMVGHEHIAGISKTTDEMGNEWVDIYSGATNPPEASNNYRYTYNWIEVDLKEGMPTCTLVVHVFPRVWIPEKACFGPDIQRLGGKESAEFLINCKNIRPATVPEPATKALAEGTKEKLPVRVVPVENQTGDSMIRDDEEGLAKLTLLFGATWIGNRG